MITKNKLEIIISDASDEWADLLNNILPKYKINTPLRVSHFIAQAAHESAGFKKLEESLNYSQDGLAKVWPNKFRMPDGRPNNLARELAHRPKEIANFVYADRYGNGGASTGDGWKYRGRGLIQTTFYDNYRALSAGAVPGCTANPDLLLLPRNAIISACWYWVSRDLNKFADDDDVKVITRKINSGMLGLQERARLTDLAKQAFLL